MLTYVENESNQFLFNLLRNASRSFGKPEMECMGHKPGEMEPHTCAMFERTGDLIHAPCSFCLSYIIYFTK